jgi:hypothetical protein
MYFLQSQVIKLVLVAVGYDNMDLAKTLSGLSAGLQAIGKPLEVFLITTNE